MRAPGVHKKLPLDLKIDMQMQFSSVQFAQKTPKLAQAAGRKEMFLQQQRKDSTKGKAALDSLPDMCNVEDLP